MAGQLLQVDTFTISSPVASVIIGGGSSGSSSYNFAINTDDVYMLAFNNVQSTNDIVQLLCRVTTSGSADTSANYDRAWKQFNDTSAFGNLSGTNESFTYLAGVQSGTGTSETNEGICYLYNFNKSDEYSFVSIESASLSYAQTLLGIGGGFVHTVQQSCDGMQIFFSVGNIASGTFTLYKVV